MAHELELSSLRSGTATANIRVLCRRLGLPESVWRHRNFWQAHSGKLDLLEYDCHQMYLQKVKIMHARGCYEAAEGQELNAIWTEIKARIQRQQHPCLLPNAQVAAARAQARQQLKRPPKKAKAPLTVEEQRRLWVLRTRKHLNSMPVSKRRAMWRAAGKLRRLRRRQLRQAVAAQAATPIPPQNGNGSHSSAAGSLPAPVLPPPHGVELFAAPHVAESAAPAAAALLS